MANKKLGSFNDVTTPDDTYHIPLLKKNNNNFNVLPSNFAKSQSVWKSAALITAFAGGGQASATSITNAVTVVSVCATDNDSVKFPAAVNGKYYLIGNGGAAACNAYPQSGENFDGLAANTPVSIAVGSYIEAVCVTAGVWYYRLTIGRYLSETSITAYAGGGQANATQLNKEFSKVTVVATNGDSVKLKAAKKGLRMVVINADAAQNLDIFPKSGDNFEGLAANTATSLAFGLSIEFFCFADGEWTEI